MDETLKLATTGLSLSKSPVVRTKLSPLRGEAVSPVTIVRAVQATATCYEELQGQENQ
ncbi:hypothetical protein CA13_52860 [Planctomycetes bacterium CA13]|uniref:Uncharacterized protein n=1 Tax=Novipirellula herctigrandis TaxID=2527986 RepID=A0A5C5Z9D1_9BACT|nr:hypothetical protein CA13_52860 [Planctomycetes bacterium CA13]